MVREIKTSERVMRQNTRRLDTYVCDTNGEASNGNAYEGRVLDEMG